MLTKQQLGYWDYSLLQEDPMEYEIGWGFPGQSEWDVYDNDDDYDPDYDPYDAEDTLDDDYDPDYDPRFAEDTLDDEKVPAKPGMSLAEVIKLSTSTLTQLAPAAMEVYKGILQAQPSVAKLTPQQLQAQIIKSGGSTDLAAQLAALQAKGAAVVSQVAGTALSQVTTKAAEDAMANMAKKYWWVGALAVGGVIYLTRR